MNDPIALAPGAVLAGRYDIVREIGRGGYSIVYQARDRMVGADVAVKLLVPPPAVAHVARERMRREVQAVRELSHEHIVAVYDLLEEETRCFIIMEYVPGPDLQARVTGEGVLTADQLVAVGRGVAAALGAAHRQGIIHRDVKPQNILLAPDGRARLTDFGSARLDGQATVTQTGGLVGTLAYTAPDVLAGERGDARADVYSLGMTLYFAATGGLPPGTSPHLPPASARDGHHPRSTRPQLPAWLDSVIARATCADPRDRFPAAASLEQALAAREAQATVARAGAVAEERCVLCGAADDAGLGVCQLCRATPSVTDALVFVRRGGDARKVVNGLVPSTISDGELRDLLRGQRPLARIRSDAAAGVLARLESRGVAARAVPARRIWTALPMSYHALVGLVLGAALSMGVVGIPLLMYGGVGVAALMAVGAMSVVRRPLMSLPMSPHVLPAPAERAVRDALAQLPVGAARSLLADVARLAATATRSPTLGERGLEEVTELVRAASDVARDLARIDESLRVLEAQRDRAGRSERWLDATSRCARARDRLVQRMLDAITVLGDVTGREEGREAAPRLMEMTRDLERTARVEAEAAREVEALLQQRS